MVVKFTFDKETKNTIKFTEEGDADSHKVGSLYVKKDALDAAKMKDAKSIEVTIKAGK